MATKNVPAPTGAPAAKSNDPTRELFFSLGAEYHLAPGARLVDLLNDCNCLFQSGLGALEEQGCESFTHTQWAALYMLRQAKAVFEQVYVRAYALAEK